jgi:hypothetical protein
LRAEAAPEGVAEAAAAEAAPVAEDALEETELRRPPEEAADEAEGAADEMVLGRSTEEAADEATPEAETEPVAAAPPPVPVKTGAV